MHFLGIQDIDIDKWPFKLEDKNVYTLKRSLSYIVVKTAFFDPSKEFGDTPLPPPPIGCEQCGLLSYRGGDRKQSVCYLLQSPLAFPSFLLFPYFLS